MSLAQRLIAWQRQHGRHALPWQQTRDPYRVWLSEIMLQQTQVSTVLGYYQRFLERLPNVAALAAAPADEVLALWSGLGYYSRARNLHRCAQQVMSEWGGAFPQRAEQLATLPGIGRSTAAAIAAFCFGERVAILDGNVKRVLSRALGFGEDLAKAAHERQLWLLAEQQLPQGEGIEAYTQGLMDLGASLCSTRQPQCSACPLAGLCRAHAQGRPESYPVKTRKLKRSRRTLALLWLQQGGAVWLLPRPQQGIWAGLWSMPEFESLPALDAWMAELSSGAGALVAAEPAGQAEVLPAITHVLTHLDLQLAPVRWHLPAGAALASLAAQRWPEGRWVSLQALDELGLPAPVRKLLQPTLQGG